MVEKGYCSVEHRNDLTCSEVEDELSAQGFENMRLRDSLAKAEAKHREEQAERVRLERELEEADSALAGARAKLETRERERSGLICHIQQSTAEWETHHQAMRDLRAKFEAVTSDLKETQANDEQTERAILAAGYDSSEQEAYEVIEDLHAKLERVLRERDDAVAESVRLGDAVTRLATELSDLRAKLEMASSDLGDLRGRWYEANAKLEAAERAHYDIHCELLESTEGFSATLRMLTAANAKLDNVNDTNLRLCHEVHAVNAKLDKVRKWRTEPYEYRSISDLDAILNGGDADAGREKDSDQKTVESLPEARSEVGGGIAQTDRTVLPAVGSSGDDSVSVARDEEYLDNDQIFDELWRTVEPWANGTERLTAVVRRMARLLRSEPKCVTCERVRALLERESQDPRNCPASFCDFIRELDDILAGSTGAAEIPNTAETAPSGSGFAMPVEPGRPEPIPMVLHCPQCGTQHVDAPNPSTGWTNPPHKSHLCGNCGCIWRSADVTTTGVQSITTRGSADNWPGERPVESGRPVHGEDEPNDEECLPFDEEDARLAGLSEIEIREARAIAITPSDEELDLLAFQTFCEATPGVPFLAVARAIRQKLSPALNRKESDASNTRKTNNDRPGQREPDSHQDSVNVNGEGSAEGAEVSGAQSGDYQARGSLDVGRPGTDDRHGLAVRAIRQKIRASDSTLKSAPLGLVKGDRAESDQDAVRGPRQNPTTSPTDSQAHGTTASAAGVVTEQSAGAPHKIPRCKTGAYNLTRSCSPATPCGWCWDAVIAPHSHLEYVTREELNEVKRCMAAGPSHRDTGETPEVRLNAMYRLVTDTMSRVGELEHGAREYVTREGYKQLLERHIALAVRVTNLEAKRRGLELRVNDFIDEGFTIDRATGEERGR